MSVEHALSSRANSGLIVIKQKSNLANPSLASTAPVGKWSISQPQLVQAAWRQEKGLLAQVAGVAGPGRVLV